MDIENKIGFGKHKGKSLKEIWSGVIIDEAYLKELSKEYMQDVLGFISGKLHAPIKIKMPAPTHNLSSSEMNDLYFKIFTRRNEIKYTIADNYIIFESDDQSLSESCVEFIVHYLNGEFQHYPCEVRVFPEDIQYSLTCEPLTIEEVTKSGDKFMLTFSQMIAGKVYRAYLNGTKSDILDKIGLDLDSYEFDDSNKVQLNVIVPKFKNGAREYEMNIQINETPYGSKNDFENLSARAKKNEKNEIVCNSFNQPLFVKKYVVLGPAKHTGSDIPKEFYSKYQFSKSSGNLISCIGEPSYISWIIQETDFYIDPDEIERLQEIEVQKLNIKAKKINSQIVRFDIEKKMSKSQLSEKLIKINYDKASLEDYDNDSWDDEEYYDHPLDSPYYNDNLDMDQQSPEFWDSI